MATWQNLPEHVLTIVFSYVDFNDKMSLFLVCKNWNYCMGNAVLWKQFSFDLIRLEDIRAQMCMLRKHIEDITSINIHVVDTEMEINIENACTIITELGKRKCNLESFTLRCSGANIVWSPLFSRILKSLDGLLASGSTKKLKHFSCSEMKFPIGDGMLTKLARNHVDLEYVDIQTPSTSVTPFSLKILFQTCPRLKKLCASFSSMSEDVIVALIEANHKSLRKLSLTFGAGRAIRRRISSQVWRRLVEHLPELRVGLNFSFLCTEMDIVSILQENMPLGELILNTLFEASKAVTLVETNYSGILEKFTITASPSPELERALLSLVQHSSHLTHFTCFCDLDPSFREAALKLQPELQCYVSRSDDFDKNFVGFMAGRSANLDKLKELGYL